MLACSCAEQGSIAPPVADLQAITEAKPAPNVDIATSQQAYDQYQASIEGWGDRIFAAGGRICRWEKKTYKLPIDCPREPTQNP